MHSKRWENAVENLCVAYLKYHDDGVNTEDAGAVGVNFVLYGFMTTLNKTEQCRPIVYLDFYL